MKAINRFIQYCDFKAIKPSRFEKDYGISNGYFSVQLKRSGSLGEDTLKIIIDNCQEINAEWLITGKGNMLKTPSVRSEKKEDNEEKEKEIARLKDKNADLQTINELLTRTIADLDKRKSLKYIESEPSIFNDVAEPKPELIVTDPKKHRK